jgi:hypothetical protein
MAEVGTWDWLRELLRGVGLESLFDQAKSGVRQGASDAEVFEAIRGTDEYRTRFSAIFEREKKGLAPINAGAILEQERQLSQMFSFYGYQLDPGQSIRDVANRTMAGDVSVNEMQARLAAYRDVADRVMNDPENEQYVREFLAQGGTPMDIGRLVVEPESLPQIEQRLRAASIVLEAKGTGMGLTQAEARWLAGEGLTGDQAEQGFGELARNAQVVGPITGEQQGMDRQRQLAALTGDVGAASEIEARRAARKAAFQGGGSFATDDEGFGGLR